MTVPTSVRDKLDERYGRVAERRSRRIIVVVAAILGALVLVSVAWSTVTGAMNAVRADGTGFQVVDERSVVVSFEVSAPVGRDIACALEALDTEHGVVGWRIVEYPASDTASRTFVETIPTVAEATTGLITSCWIP